MTKQIIYKAYFSDNMQYDETIFFERYFTTKELAQNHLEDVLIDSIKNDSIWHEEFNLEENAKIEEIELFDY